MIEKMLRWFPYVRQLEQDHDALLEKYEKVLVGEITLEKVAIENGCLEARFGTKMAEIMANCFYNLLEDREAVNYLECQFTSTDGNRITVTIQRHWGKTPHELRQQAEAERDELKRQLEAKEARDGGD